MNFFSFTFQFFFKTEKILQKIVYWLNLIYNKQNYSWILGIGTDYNLKRITFAMAEHCDSDLHFAGRFTLSSELFKNMRCVSEAADTECDDVKILDEDKMKRHIIDCLVALRRVQRFKRMHKICKENEQYETAKRRIFASAISMIIDEQSPIESDQDIFSSLLAPFPGKKKRTDDHSWLPMHLKHLFLGIKSEKRTFMK